MRLEVNVEFIFYVFLWSFCGFTSHSFASNNAVVRCMAGDDLWWPCEAICRCRFIWGNIRSDLSSIVASEDAIENFSTQNGKKLCVNITENYWKSLHIFIHPEGSVSANTGCCCKALGIILCMCPGNERWRYNVTPSLIGWAHTQNDPWTRDNLNAAGK